GSIGKRHNKNLADLCVETDFVSFRKTGIKGIVEKIKHTNADFIIDALGTNNRHFILPYIKDTKKPFYLEKPAYFSNEIGNILTDMPEDLQKKSVIGYMMRYNPIIRSLEDDIKSIKPFSASMHVGNDVNKWRQDWNFSKSYSANSFGGGVLLDLCHEIDLSNVLFSVDEVVSVSAKKYKKFKVDFVTNCVLRNSERNIKDILTNISLNYLSPNLIRKSYVYGLCGEIKLDLVNGSKINNYDNKQKVEVFSNSRNNMFLDLMIDFLLSLIDEKVKNPLFPSVKNTKTSNNLIASCYENIRF
ncbi:hypothetical protein OBA40_09520, partial [Alphaproteobacteria bacterium]|nr:hypothetical protein [Alphaproteobacteria bacterium]